MKIKVHSRVYIDASKVTEEVYKSFVARIQSQPGAITLPNALEHISALEIEDADSDFLHRNKAAFFRFFSSEEIMDSLTDVKLIESLGTYRLYEGKMKTNGYRSIYVHPLAMKCPSTGKDYLVFQPGHRTIEDALGFINRFKSIYRKYEDLHDGYRQGDLLIAKLDPSTSIESLSYSKRTSMYNLNFIKET